MSRFPIPILTALLLTVSCDALAPEPGQGSVAEQGYRNFQPTIDALDAYREREGHYPESLGALIRAGDLPEAPNAPQPDHIAQYTPRPDGYELLFTYSGPGMNRCVHRPATGWACEGYY